MNIHEIVLLAIISILSMQQSFAASTNYTGVEQSARTKATLVMPVKKYIGVVAGPGGTARRHTQTTAVIRDNVIAKRGVNLKLLSFGWDDEICAQACPQVRQYGLNYATCDLAFRVTNTGDEASGSFSVHLVRTTHLGTDVSVLLTAPNLYKLAPHETKTFKISPVTLGLYTVGRPFALTVDRPNRIAETNENDNTATFIAPY